MSTNVASLNVRFLADTRNFNQGVSGLIGRLNSFRNFIGTLSGLAIGNFVVSQLKAADALNKMADRTKWSVENLAKLKEQAELSDVDLPTLQNAILKLNKAIGEGNSSTIELLKTMGLQLQELQNMSPENRFLAVLEKLKAIEDPTKQAAAGNKLFQEQWFMLLPFMISGAMDDLKKRMEDKSGPATMSKNFADASTSILDSITSIGIKLVNLATTAMEPFAQAVAETFKWVDEKVEGFGPKLLNMMWTGGLKNPASAIGGLAIDYAQNLAQLPAWWSGGDTQLMSNDTIIKRFANRLSGAALGTDFGGITPSAKGSGFVTRNGEQTAGFVGGVNVLQPMNSMLSGITGLPNTNWGNIQAPSSGSGFIASGGNMTTEFIRGQQQQVNILERIDMHLSKGVPARAQ